MSYGLLNAIGITVLALAGLWIFGKSAILHSKDKKSADDTPEK